jgi:hypothetical protein
LKTDASTVKKLIGKKDFVAAFGGLWREKLAKAPSGEISAFFVVTHPDFS